MLLMNMSFFHRRASVQLSSLSTAVLTVGDIEEAPQHSHPGIVFPLRSLPQAVHAVKQLVKTHKDTLGRSSIPMSRVQSPVYRFLESEEAPAVPFGHAGAAACLQRLPATVPEFDTSDGAHAHAHGRAAVFVQHVPEEFRSFGQVKASYADAFRRSAVFV